MNQINEAKFVSKRGHILNVARMGNNKTLKFSGSYNGEPEEITTLDCTLERFIEEYTREGSYYTLVNTK